MCPLSFRRSHAFLPFARSFVVVEKAERVKDKSYSGGGARGQPKPQPKPPLAAAAKGFLRLFRRSLRLPFVALSAFCVRVWGSAAVAFPCLNGSVTLCVTLPHLKGCGSG